MRGDAKQISSGVLQMKFMTKTRKKLEHQEKQKKEKELRKEFIVEPGAAECGSSDGRGIQYCKDLSVLEDLAFGRMSFKGCNPEVEKLMVYYESKRRGEVSDEEEDEEKDVTDAEMAQKLAGASAAMAKKFKQKAQRNEHETASDRLNFDASSIRKRKSDSTWAEQQSQPKFMKPSD